MLLDSIAIMIWLIIGVIVLARGKITRLDYGLCWFCLILNLIVRLMTHAG